MEFFIGINRFKIKGNEKNNRVRDDPKTAKVIATRTGKTVLLKEVGKQKGEKVSQSCEQRNQLAIQKERSEHEDKGDTSQSLCQADITTGFRLNQDAKPQSGSKNTNGQ